MTTPATIRDLAQDFRPLMFEAARYIWNHPQIGFNEWKASNYLKGMFSGMGFHLVEAGNIPGFRFDIDTGRPGPTFAIIGELDALVVPDHPACDKETGAVHACGHHCQAASLLGVAGVLQNPSVLAELCGRIRIVAVPAEELIDLDARAAMRAKGTIRHLSGKTEFMARGFFDGVDLAAMIHTSRGDKPGMYVGPGLTGLVAKRITYFGSNDGSFSPRNLANPLHAAHTAMCAINALRESLYVNDWEHARCQEVITEGGRGVIPTPGRVVMEAQVRATDFDVLREVNAKINRAYTAAAAAFGARVEIEDLETYLPENDSPEFMKLAYGIACELFGEGNVRIRFDENGRSMGASDMGNLGAVIPVIQPSTFGQTGSSHCPDFAINSLELAVFDPATVLAALTCALLRNGGKCAREIIAEYKPRFASIGDFLHALDENARFPKGIEYGERSAILNW